MNRKTLFLLFKKIKNKNNLNTYSVLQNIRSRVLCFPFDISKEYNYENIFADGLVESAKKC